MLFMFIVMMEVMLLFGVVEQTVAQTRHLREHGSPSERGLAGFLQPFEDRLPLLWGTMGHFAMDLSFVLLAVPAPRVKIDRQIVFLGRTGFNAGVKKAMVVGGVRILLDFLLVVNTTRDLNVLLGINIMASNSLPANIIGGLIFSTADGSVKSRIRAAIKTGVGAWVSNVVAAAAYWLTLAIAVNDESLILTLLKVGIAKMKIGADDLHKFIFSLFFGLLSITHIFFFASQKALKEIIITLKGLEESTKSQSSLSSRPHKSPRIETHNFTRSNTGILDPEEAYELGYTAVPFVMSSLCYMATWFVSIMSTTKTFYTYVVVNVVSYFVFKAWMNRRRRKKAISENLQRLMKVKKEKEESEQNHVARSVAALLLRDFGDKGELMLDHKSAGAAVLVEGGIERVTKESAIDTALRSSTNVKDMDMLHQATGSIGPSLPQLSLEPLPQSVTSIDNHPPRLAFPTFPSSSKEPRYSVLQEASEIQSQTSTIPIRTFQSLPKRSSTSRTPQTSGSFDVSSKSIRIASPIPAPPDRPNASARTIAQMLTSSNNLGQSTLNIKPASNMLSHSDLTWIRHLRPLPTPKPNPNYDLRDFLVSEAAQTLGELGGTYLSIMMVGFLGTLVLSQDALFPSLDQERCGHGLMRTDYVIRSGIILTAHLAADTLLVWTGSANGIPFDMAMTVKFPVEMLLGVAVLGCTNACLIIAAFRGASSEVQNGMKPCLPKPYSMW
ncbi:hypothetical protein HDU67_003232 [Dinochytrium kinnereticum]|nr:hypothetical protein HDU67_003232 [Dinochytrium kinnereticum]